MSDKKNTLFQDEATDMLIGMMNLGEKKTTETTPKPENVKKDEKQTPSKTAVKTKKDVTPKQTKPKPEKIKETTQLITKTSEENPPEETKKQVKPVSTVKKQNTNTPSVGENLISSFRYPLINSEDEVARKNYKIREVLLDKLNEFNETRMLKSSYIVTVIIEAYLTQGFLFESFDKEFPDRYMASQFKDRKPTKKSILQTLIPIRYIEKVEESAMELNYRYKMNINSSNLIDLIVEDFLFQMKDK